MAGFLYHDSGPAAPSHEELLAMGLGYLFPTKSVSVGFCGVTNGPSKTNGRVFARGGHFKEASIGYFPDRQSWRKVPLAARSGQADKLCAPLWVGYYTDDPPTPATLLRDRAIRGHNVELGDGNEWMIPVARQIVDDDGSPTAICALPHAVGLAEDGTWSRGEVVAQHEKLWEVATGWWDGLATGMGLGDGIAEGPVRSVFEFEKIAESAFVALSTNYMISAIEVALLGLFTETTMIETLQAVIDWPTVVAWREKKTGNPGL